MREQERGYIPPPDCPKCRGSGWSYAISEVCSTCKGTGQLPRNTVQ